MDDKIYVILIRHHDEVQASPFCGSREEVEQHKELYKDCPYILFEAKEIARHGDWT
ncbi:MAG: hypothetical protein ACXADB_07260 [Candidatus Hermodarchaeia archaeon]|jgi:hypothetical protein